MKDPFLLHLIFGRKKGIVLRRYHVGIPIKLSFNANMRTRPDHGRTSNILVQHDQLTRLVYMDL